MDVMLIVTSLVAASIIMQKSNGHFGVQYKYHGDFQFMFGVSG